MFRGLLFGVAARRTMVSELRILLSARSGQFGARKADLVIVTERSGWKKMVEGMQAQVG